MQNVFFMKEALVSIDKNVLFIMLGQKQANEALVFTINSILAQPQKSVICVTLTIPGTELLPKINPENTQRLTIIDAFSKDEENTNPKIRMVNNSDLTGIQIGVEKAEKTLPGEKIIIFDALNVLSIYNKTEEVGKFLHLFSNKTRYKENSAIIFTIKESTDPEIIQFGKEFSDKTFDYSELFISAISIAEK